jgi:DNA repair exonuclease SbcCD ATPase subunit
MSRNLIFSAIFSATAVWIVPSSLAADQPSAELKLRESLRATMLQLRTAETERANLQAAKAELEAKNKALEDQLASMTKQTAANQAEAEKTITELKTKMDERDREIGTLRVSLDKWKVDHQKISDLARTKEGQRVKLTEKVVVLERQVADQQRRNAAMYKLGREVLDRYEKFGLGTALTAREPFVGLTRVKFENLIQDYGDKLADERIKPQTQSATSKPKESQ